MIYRNISIWKIHKKVEIQSIDIPLRKISSKTNGNLDKFEIDTILAYRIRLRQNTYSYLPNKRAGPNKRVGWKIDHNQIIV